MDATARLGLPYLSAGQAQKELVHNLSLEILDIVVGAAVEEPPRSAPPADAVSGSCYITSDAPTGDWAGKPHCVATLGSSGWSFVPAVDGMTAYVRSSDAWALRRAGAWEIGILRGASVAIGGKQVVGSRAAPIAAPSGGTTVDGEARSAIGAILAALRTHGLIET